MEQYQVKKLYGQVTKKELVVSVPGSKSITNRALLLATLAEGKSVLEGVLFSDDSRHFLACVQELGFDIVIEEDAARVTVTGNGGAIPNKEASIYVGSAGTAARFLTALLGVSEGTYELNSSEQMKKRPMAPLLKTLRELGATVRCKEKEGYFPFTVEGTGNPSNHATVNIDSSSQFLSALLIAFGAKEKECRVEAEGTHGMAYIDMTVRMMEQFGVKTKKEQKQFIIESGQQYKALAYQIEPDVSAACYFYAMAPLLGIRVLVKHVHFDGLQGDVAFIRFLEQMGCGVEDTEEGIWVDAPKDGVLHGIDADMHACSDQAITLACLAPFAAEPTTIRGIGHIRLQESDRLHGIAAELTKMGIACEEYEDSITIYPGEPQASVVKTYEDHRMAMGFSLIGLRSEGIVIDDPLCCRKTFETYFTVLDEVSKSLTE